MSVKSALAKLSATAAGGALLAGGAVHVAERPISDNPQYKSKAVKYVKQATPRAVPRPTVPRARTIPRPVECVPADSPAAANSPNNICPPVYRQAMAPVPVPPLPAAAPVRGGGASRSIGGSSTSGGGGFGDPAERDPADAERDHDQGYLE